MLDCQDLFAPYNPTMRYKRRKILVFSPAAKSSTPLRGLYMAQLLINRRPYRWGRTASTRFLMSGFKNVYSSMTNNCIYYRLQLLEKVILKYLVRVVKAEHSTQYPQINVKLRKQQLTAWFIETIDRYIGITAGLTFLGNKCDVGMTS